VISILLVIAVVLVILGYYVYLTISVRRMVTSPNFRSELQMAKWVLYQVNQLRMFGLVSIQHRRGLFKKSDLYSFVLLDKLASSSSSTTQSTTSDADELEDIDDDDEKLVLLKPEPIKEDKRKYRAREVHITSSSSTTSSYSEYDSGEEENPEVRNSFSSMPLEIGRKIVLECYDDPHSEFLFTCHMDTRASKSVTIPEIVGYALNLENFHEECQDICHFFESFGFYLVAEAYRTEKARWYVLMGRKHFEGI